MLKTRVLFALLLLSVSLATAQSATKKSPRVTPPQLLLDRFVYEYPYGTYAKWTIPDGKNYQVEFFVHDEEAITVFSPQGKILSQQLTTTYGTVPTAIEYQIEKYYPKSKTKSITRYKNDHTTTHYEVIFKQKHHLYTMLYTPNGAKIEQKKGKWVL